jgi:regulator of protease activity HflC (stomatin/prohibitin superfamily)
MWWLILLIAVLYFFSGINIVNENETMVIESFGKFKNIAGPGFCYLFRIFERPRFVTWSFKNAEEKTLKTLKTWKIPLEVLRYDPKPLECTTSDNFRVQLDLVVNFKISDPKKAVYSTQNAFSELEDKIETRLYETVRTFKFDELVLGAIVARFNFQDFNANYNCGIKIDALRVQKILYPKEIINSTLEIQRQQLQKHAQIEQRNAEREHELKMLESKKLEFKARRELENMQLDHEMSKSRREAEHKKAMDELQISSNFALWDRISASPTLAQYLIAQEYTNAAKELGKDGKGKKLIIFSGKESHLGELPVIKELLK